MSTARQTGRRPIPSKAADPIRQFARWMAAAQRADPRDYNAMTLATAGAGGAPSARIVLLKGVDARGFVFFTNYRSRKGRELAQAGAAALVLWWPALRRQVRVEGRVVRVARVESEAYFQSRPRAYRLGAWASRQSAALASRATLVARLRAAAARFRGREVPCPPHWGGFRLAPARIEFWAERPNRLHERVLFRRGRDGRWQRRRLSP